MLTAAQTYLSWNLAEETEYRARTELELTVSLTLPRDGSFYLLGGLFTPDTLNYIQGTLFGVLVPEGADYGVNDPNWVSIFNGSQGESLDLPCRLTLDRTDVVLGLFFLEMKGEAPDLAVDEEVGALSTRLVRPAGLDIGQLMTAVLIVAMMGMIVPIIGMTARE